MGSGVLEMRHTIDIHTKNKVHPTAVIDDGVVMGVGNYVGPHCYLTGHLDIGNNNRFEAHCSVGTRPEHKEYWHKDGYTEIGNNNTFREFITINSGTTTPTKIENNIIMLRGAHVAHDCIIEDGTTLSVGAIILGHVHVMRESNCGSGCQIHQYQVVGTWSMIGMGAIVPKKVRVEPGKVWVGNPAKELKTNDYLMRQVSVDSHRYEAKRFLELVEQHEL